MITQHELKEHLEYDEVTGQFTWLKGRRKGQIAGANKGDGYFRVAINKKRRYSHRLAFLYMEGYIPEQVDHIDGDRGNNSWINLRAVTNLENCRNKSMTSRNKSGANGVYFSERLKKWTAEIRHNGKSIRLGWFKPTEDGKQQAIEARKEAERTYGYHDNHGRQ